MRSPASVSIVRTPLSTTRFARSRWSELSLTVRWRGARVCRVGVALRSLDWSPAIPVWRRWP